MSMSSKDPSAVNCAHGTFRYLCWLSPAKTVPVILPQIYSALESFTQVQSADYRRTGQYHLSVVQDTSRLHFSLEITIQRVVNIFFHCCFSLCLELTQMIYGNLRLRSSLSLPRFHQCILSIRLTYLVMIWNQKRTNTAVYPHLSLTTGLQASWREYLFLLRLAKTSLRTFPRIMVSAKAMQPTRRIF